MDARNHSQMVGLLCWVPCMNRLFFGVFAVRYHEYITSFFYLQCSLLQGIDASSWHVHHDSWMPPLNWAWRIKKYSDEREFLQPSCCLRCIDLVLIHQCSAPQKLPLREMSHSHIVTLSQTSQINAYHPFNVFQSALLQLQPIKGKL